MQGQSPTTWFLFAMTMAFAACGSGENGVGGTGGAPSGGGGASAKGGSGAGGTGTGGAGGVSAAGGAGAGGAGSGGAPAGDAAGSDGAPADSSPAPDTGTGGSPTPVGAEKSLADCFADLRKLQGWSIQASKRSADGKVHVRLAVETADRFGTSGTSPFALVRFAIVADGKMTCLTSPPAGAYKVSHHNCKDTASITVDDVRYELSAPVSPMTPISAFAGTTKLWGPVIISDTSCTAARSNPASEMKCAVSPSPCP